MIATPYAWHWFVTPEGGSVGQYPSRHIAWNMAHIKIQITGGGVADSQHSYISKKKSKKKRIRKWHWAVTLAVVSPYQGVKLGPGPGLGIQSWLWGSLFTSESRAQVMMDPPWLETHGQSQIVWNREYQWLHKWAFSISYTIPSSRTWYPVLRHGIPSSQTLGQ